MDIVVQRRIRFQRHFEVERGCAARAAVLAQDKPRRGFAAIAGHGDRERAYNRTILPSLCAVSNFKAAPSALDRSTLAVTDLL